MDILLHIIFNFLLSFMVFKEWRYRLYVIIGGVLPDAFLIFRLFYLSPIAKFFHYFFGITIVIIIIFIISYFYKGGSERFIFPSLLYSGCFLHWFVDCISHTYTAYPQPVFYPLDTPLNIDKYWYFGLYGEASLIFSVLLAFIASYFLIIIIVKLSLEDLSEGKKVLRAMYEGKYSLDKTILVVIIIFGIISLVILSVWYYMGWSIPVYPFPYFEHLLWGN